MKTGQMILLAIVVLAGIVLLVIALGNFDMQPANNNTTTQPPQDNDTLPTQNTSSNGQQEVAVAEFLNNLREEGLQPELLSTIEQPFTDTQAQVIALGAETIQAFEFASQAEAETFASSVSADGTQIDSTSVFWVGPPHFYQSENLVVLYIGDSQEVLGTLEEVLGAQFAGSTPGAGTGNNGGSNVSLTPTACNDSERPSDYCIEVYQPVCGLLDNGERQTFSNSCFACMNRSVTQWTEGACEN